MNTIPKLIHQTAPKDKNMWHPIWNKCHQSWKKNFDSPEYHHILWTDEMIDDFIKYKFNNYWEIYNMFPLHIMKLDFFRYCLLYEYGGIYADMDMYCYTNFFDTLNGKCFLLESYCDDDQEKIQNCLLVSEKNNFFIKKCIEESIKVFLELFKDINHLEIKNPENQKSSFFIKKTFGPYFLTNLYKKFYDQDPDNLPLLLKKEIYNNHHLTYSENYVTKHMLTGRWGKDQMLILVNKNLKEYPQYDHETFLKLGYFNFRNVDVDSFDFKKNYIMLD